jgi:hypothetical protein
MKEVLQVKSGERYKDKKGQLRFGGFVVEKENLSDDEVENLKLEEVKIYEAGESPVVKDEKVEKLLIKIDQLQIENEQLKTQLAEQKKKSKGK